MNKKIGLVLTLLIALLVLWMGHKESSKEHPLHNNEAKAQGTSPSLQARKAGEIKEENGQTILAFQDQQGQPQQKILNEKEKSFVALTRSFLDFTDPDKTPDDFIAHLQSLGLKPIVAHDKQDLIEDLTIIRTENTLPGVRYIHAQFDGDGKQSLQHFSFEIRKGPKAYEKAIQLLQDTLGLGEPMPNTASDMTIFKRNGYVIWASKLALEDMMGDPFNAYEKSDVGNIRIAIERDIHEHEHEHNEHNEH